MYCLAQYAAVDRSERIWAADAPVASSARAISAAPQSMSLFHWLPG